MIADPPSALALLLKRLMARRERPRRQSPLDGGALRADPQLPMPKEPLRGASALKALAPPRTRDVDVLALPDRDHLRVVVPDPDFVDLEAVRRVRASRRGR